MCVRGEGLERHPENNPGAQQGRQRLVWACVRNWHDTDLKAVRKKELAAVSIELRGPGGDSAVLMVVTRVCVMCDMCVCVYVCMCICVYMCVCVYVCMFVCVYVCVYLM